MNAPPPANRVFPLDLAPSKSINKIMDYCSSTSKKRKAPEEEPEEQQEQQHPRRRFASESEFVTFYSKSANKDMRLLSNFAAGPHPIAIDFTRIKSMPSNAGSASFQTGEHAFQGGKYRILALCCSSSGDPGRAAQLMAHAQTFEAAAEGGGGGCYPTAVDAKRAGGKNGGVRLTEQEMEHWGHLCMELQEEICRAKLATDPRVAAVLRATGDKYLLHHERSTRGWPRYGASVGKADADGFRPMKGDNLLGQMWMTVREEEAQEDEEKEH